MFINATSPNGSNATASNGINGINAIASNVGSIAQTLNSQAYSTYSNFADSLPTITAMSNSAYGFASAAQANVNSSFNALATNVVKNVNNATSANQQMVNTLATQAPGQYQSIAQNAGGKK